MINRVIYLLSLSIVLIIGASCQKEYLAKKTNKALLVPTTLKDFDAILDGVSTFNNNFPALMSLASDDFYITENGIMALDQLQQSTYKWESGIFNGHTSVPDWNYQYRKIFHANVVLDGLGDMDVTDNDIMDFNRIKGTALFHRAFAYYSLSQLFIDPFLTEELGKGAGLFLRLEADINQESERATISETYGQIISDLEEAAELLPHNRRYKTRPNKNAAWALLARIYLSMANYDDAKRYADRCLSYNDKLVAFSSLDLSLSNPFPQIYSKDNEEIVYYSDLILYMYMISSLVSVDSLLYDSYNVNDLRKAAFFTSRGTNIHSFTGSYSGSLAVFNGLANDELLLIRAECLAREGNVVQARNDLNYLLQNRYEESFFESVQLNDAKELLDLILLERRKELVGRGLRWSDLRRLNHEDGYSITLYRHIGDERYELSPQAEFYTFPLPDYEE